MGRSTLHAATYHLLRLLPAVGFFLFGAFPPYLPPEDVRTRVTGCLILVSLLVVWGMAEGTFMLWHKVRTSSPLSSSASRGYLIVTGMLAFCMLMLLQVFRARVSQEIFVLTLITFSLRGLSRSAWEQRRERIATPATWLGAAILTSVSFWVLKGSSPWPLDWQILLVAISVGAQLVAIESTWYARGMLIDSVIKWQLPLFRITLFIGPILIGFLVFMGQLPLCYLWLYGALFLGQKVSRQASKRGFLSREDAPSTLLCSGVFFLLLGACRAYESGWFF